MGMDRTALVAKRILERLSHEFDYIDITGYIGDGVGRYDDETWERIAFSAAQAALEVLDPTSA